VSQAIPWFYEPSRGRNEENVRKLELYSESGIVCKVRTQDLDNFLVNPERICIQQTLTFGTSM